MMINSFTISGLSVKRTWSFSAPIICCFALIFLINVLDIFLTNLSHVNANVWVILWTDRQNYSLF